MIIVAAMGRVQIRSVEFGAPGSVKGLDPKQEVECGAKHQKPPMVWPFNLRQFAEDGKHDRPVDHDGVGKGALEGEQNEAASHSIS